VDILGLSKKGEVASACAVNCLYHKFCDRRLLHLDQTCSKAIRRFSAVVRYIHVAIVIALFAWCLLNCSCHFSIAILIVVTMSRFHSNLPLLKCLFILLFASFTES